MNGSSEVVYSADSTPLTWLQFSMSSRFFIMCCQSILKSLTLVLLTFVTNSPAWGQRMEGDLTILIRDSVGQVLSAHVELTNPLAGFTIDGYADAKGKLHFRHLPTGAFELRIDHPGFHSQSERIAISSALPIVRQYVLKIASLKTILTVKENASLVHTGQVGTASRIGRTRLNENPFSTMGRSMINAVNTLPGWLLEANAVLHPRGSEYDTQYVIDGMPLYDNRSLGFVSGFDDGEFEAVHVITANIPAEFGRRLGGIIELATRRPTTNGRHTELTVRNGSFSTTEGIFSSQHRTDGAVFSFGLRGGHTDRYLDPPSLENFTNRGSSAGVNVGFEHDFNEQDRIHLYLRSARLNFLVPNTIEQQLAQQRQDRQSGEISTQLHFQHVFSSRAMIAVRSMVRDVGTKLWSNSFATPVFTEQNRGFREGVLASTATFETGHQIIKFGGDYRTTNLREHFFFRQTKPIFSNSFRLDDNRRVTDAAAFVQTNYRRGGLALGIGLRADHHHIWDNENGLSPRLGLSYYWAPGDLILQTSFDRVFQTPANENLLLSASQMARSLDDAEGFLPIPVSRANFYEIGITKLFSSSLRLDVKHYWRNFKNYYDDDVFLNTGISLPISFHSARIEGTEISLEMPSYRRLGVYLSYSNMLGKATSPVTGGLFVQGNEADELRYITSIFPISQDQRNTVSLIMRYEFNSRTRLSVAARYGSGLPVELDDDDDDHDEGSDISENLVDNDLDDHAEQLIPVAILRQINFARSRIRPNFQLDLSLGVKIWEKGRRAVDLQFDVTNSTNRLNVINFSGLFSGTALAPNRMVGIHLKTRF